MNKLNRIALAATILCCVGQAQAQLTAASAASSFSGTASVTATGAGVLSATASNSNAAIATAGVGQFNSSTGVLVGADILLNSNLTQTISGVGNKNNGPGRDANGIGSSSALIAAPGISSTFQTAASLAGTGCTLAMGPTGAISCSWGPVSSAAIPSSVNLSANAASLDSYVGTGTTSVSLSLPSLSATTTLSSIKGMAGAGSSSTYSVNLAGNVQANYSYLLHSAASFDGFSALGSLTLDFGTLSQGSSAAPLNFSLFNLADANRVGLDLDSIVATGDSRKLTTNLATFANLAQGGSNAYNAFLDTSTAGSFSSQYVLNLSDADVGASSTRSNYLLTVNLVGNVAAVPEPETYAMLLTGLGLVGGFARRRKARQSSSQLVAGVVND